MGTKIEEISINKDVFECVFFFCTRTEATKVTLNHIGGSGELSFIIISFA